MKTMLRAFAIAAFLLCCHAHAQTCSSAAGPEYFNPLTSGDGQRYPLTVGPVSWKVLGAPIQPVKGSDGKVHVAYVLLLTNSWTVEADVQSIQVVDPAKNNAATGNNRVLNVVNDDITGQLRLLSIPATLRKDNFSTKLPPGQSAIVYFNLTYADASEVPRSIAHRFTVKAIDQHKTPKDFVVLSPPVELNCQPPVVLQPPFKGDGWINGNGCCTEIGPHRFVMNSINGTLAPTETFAIDWIKVDKDGKYFHDDFKRPENWLCYGTELLAVAPGTIVEVMTDIPDAVPGKTPDNLTIEQIAGNRVIIDIGSGHFAEYDHLAPHSATVHVGDHVTVGQKIGLLGNTGNSDAPHLHFQLMDRPSSLDGSALPFVFESMQLQGRIIGSMGETDDAVIKGNAMRIERNASKQLKTTMPLSLDMISFE